MSSWEVFLVNAPPDYPSEWRNITTRLALCAASFVVVVSTLPVLSSSSPAPDSPGPDESSQQRQEIRKKKRDKRRKPTQKVEQDKSTESKIAPETETVVEVPPLLPVLNMLCLLCACVLVCIIVGSSPNNRTARAVYQAPLLTTDECRHIIDMAHAAAERNVELASKEAAKHEFLRSAGIISRVDDEADDFVQQHQRNNNEGQPAEGRSLLDEPRGWTKDRHTSYPTTDLNLVTDPFTANDREFLKRRLDARLAPLLQRIYGIPPRAIRANDIFVVRYDYENGQKSLRGHTDSSHVSFNILLNDEFSGGGTR